MSAASLLSLHVSVDDVNPNRDWRYRGGKPAGLVRDQREAFISGSCSPSILYPFCMRVDAFSLHVCSGMADNRAVTARLQPIESRRTALRNQRHFARRCTGARLTRGSRDTFTNSALPRASDARRYVPFQTINLKRQPALADRRDPPHDAPTKEIQCFEHVPSFNSDYRLISPVADSLIEMRGICRRKTATRSALSRCMHES